MKARRFSPRLFMIEMDSSGDAELDADELHAALGKVGVEVTAEECKALVTAMDSDGNGQISALEFERALSRFHTMATSAICKLRRLQALHHFVSITHARVLSLQPLSFPVQFGKSISIFAIGICASRILLRRWIAVVTQSLIATSCRRHCESWG